MTNYGVSSVYFHARMSEAKTGNRMVAQGPWLDNAKPALLQSVTGEHADTIKEPLIYCDSGMQGKASRSETRGLS